MASLGERGGFAATCAFDNVFVVKKSTQLHKTAQSYRILQYLGPPKTKHASVCGELQSPDHLPGLCPCNPMSTAVPQTP